MALHTHDWKVYEVGKVTTLERCQRPGCLATCRRDRKTKLIAIFRDYAEYPEEIQGNHRE